MANELKPCPFCGGDAVIEGDTYQWIVCNNCGAETMGNEDIEVVIERWNRRAEDG